MELDKKIISLESEFKVIKGEIKKLLVDLREIMNNSENPFYTGKTSTIHVGSLKAVPDIAKIPEDGPDYEEKEEIASENNEDTLLPGKNSDLPPAHEAEGSAGESAGLEENPDLMALLREYAGLAQVESRGKKVLTGPDDSPESFSRAATPQEDFDIFTLIELMRWTDYTLRIIEKEKLKEALELYELTGYLPGKIKETILKIARLSDEGLEPEYRTTMKDYITALSQLNTILNPGEFDPRLMHFIYEGMPWRKCGSKGESAGFTGKTVPSENDPVSSGYNIIPSGYNMKPWGNNRSEEVSRYNQRMGA